ncbi:hypothetical protein [Rubrivivax gelatinosus]|uniref:hypothetical protein n=1 Tax=Rubrivivax gelatinosus TaxID=28068 RepID=UPI001404526E|nr:hypothetical protein [Rubrivivax gelatinosus]
MPTNPIIPSKITDKRKKKKHEQPDDTTRSTVERATDFDSASLRDYHCRFASGGS